MLNKPDLLQHAFRKLCPISQKEYYLPEHFILNFKTILHFTVRTQ